VEIGGKLQKKHWGMRKIKMETTQEISKTLEPQQQVQSPLKKIK